MSSPAANRKYKKSPQAKRKFVFDLNKPILTGYLQKQGELLGVTFKQCFFVLYPGFLVYYDEKDTWRYDLQRGETLGSRLGAIKLLNGSVEKAKNPPRGTKYPFVIHSPDPNNKKKELICNCQSNEERYQWMTKISSAIPVSKSKGNEEKEQEKEKENKGSLSPLPPAPKEEKGDQKENEEVKDEKHDQKEEVSVKQEEATALSASTESLDKDTDEVLGPQTNDHDSENEELVTSFASIEVKPQTEEKTEEPPELVQRDSIYIDDIKEVLITQPESSQFTISVIDTSMLAADNDEDSSAEDLPSGPESTNSSPPPEIVVQEEEEEEEETKKAVDAATLSPPPSITVVDESVSDRQPNSADTTTTNNNTSPSPTSGMISPTRGSPVFDRRRPTGASSFIDKRGFLYKEGGKHKSWNLRYFVLQPGVFHYYKNDPKGKALGEVKLKNIKITFPKSGQKKFSSYQFTVHTESSWNKRKDWVIAATSDKEMKDWIEAFKTAGGILPTSNGSE